jgi:hypothetical protein
MIQVVVQSTDSRCYRHSLPCRRLSTAQGGDNFNNLRENSAGIKSDFGEGIFMEHDTGVRYETLARSKGVFVQDCYEFR